jgi:hypothetical protein
MADDEGLRHDVQIPRVWREDVDTGSSPKAMRQRTGRDEWTPLSGPTL